MIDFTQHDFVNFILLKDCALIREEHAYTHYHPVLKSIIDEFSIAVIIDSSNAVQISVLH